MMDFCQIVSDIEKDPSAITPIKTLRDLLLLKAHVAACQSCSEKVERVLQHSPSSEAGPAIGLN